MKRAILALVVTVFAITTICTSCTVSPPPSVECDFGYTDATYALGNSLARMISPGCDVEFDEFFEDARIREFSHSQRMFGLYLKPAEGKYLCFRDTDYDNTGNSGGYIEKLVGDEWKYYCESGNAIGDNEESGGWSPYPLRVDEAKTPNLRAYAPIFADPGDYRVTLYFRKCDESGSAVDGDIHRVSFETSVPEHSEKPFDVIQAELSTDGVFPQVTVLVRQNDRSKPLPYIDRSSFTLAYEDGDKLVKVEPRKDTDSVAFCPDGGSRDGAFAEYSFGLYYPVEEFDLTKTYRMSVELSSNEDGSGEQYTLTLRLRFEE